MLDPAIRRLILAEQARQQGHFIDGTDLESYLDKLGARAEILSHGVAGTCRGIVAFYANDAATRQAYITLVLVAPEARGAGLGGALVRGALAICRARGFETCRLEVRTDNAVAFAMYDALGFSAVEDRGEKRLLEVRL